MAFDGNTWLTYVIFALIVVLALLGNSLVLYVLVTRPSYLKHSYNIFILSLAITDIVTAIFLVFSRFLYLPPTPTGHFAREIYCRTIWSAAIVFALGYVSVYTCVALTIDRWLAVVKPLVYRSIKPQHVKKAVVLIWIWGILLNVVVAFRAKFSKAKHQCTWQSLAVGNEELPWLHFTLQAIIPATSMVFLYSHILYTLKMLPKFAGGPHQAITKTTFVALAASCAILIGWLPGRITFMMSKFGKVDPNGLPQFSLVLLGFSNSCVNPILYGIYSSQFRREYKKTFKKLFACFTSKEMSSPPVDRVRITR